MAFLSVQNYGGGMRPPLNSMGPGMPGMNMLVSSRNFSIFWLFVTEMKLELLNLLLL